MFRKSIIFLIIKKPIKHLELPPGISILRPYILVDHSVANIFRKEVEMEGNDVDDVKQSMVVNKMHTCDMPHIKIKPCGVEVAVVPLDK